MSSKYIKSEISLFFQELYQTPLFQDGMKSMWNAGYYPVDPQLALFSNVDQYQLQLYYEALKLAPVQFCLGCDHGQEEIRILDIGCGAGGGIRFLQQMFPRLKVVGIDFSYHALELCEKYGTNVIHSNKSRVESKKKNTLEHCYVYEGDFNILSLILDQEEPFDIILCIEMNPFVDEIYHFVCELRNCLKMDGLLIISDFFYDQMSEDTSLSMQLQQEGSMMGFQALEQRDISFHVAMAAKHQSKKLNQLIESHVSIDLQNETKEKGLIKNTKVYEQLRLGQVHYVLNCFQYQNYEKGKVDLNPFASNISSTSLSINKSPIEDEEEEEEDLTSEEDDDIEIDDSYLANYYDYRLIFPELEILKENFHLLRQELIQVMNTNWPSWPEDHYVGPQNDWKVFPFCYTFPADDPKQMKWINYTTQACPKTTEILRKIPSLRTALYSRLGPGTTLSPHRGWADLANHILRCHLGLIVPSLENDEIEEGCCSMIVSNEKRSQAENELLVFDDSKLHYAYNRHPTETRYVLILDCFRPLYLPRGVAIGGHTDELDHFIASFEEEARNSARLDE